MELIKQRSESSDFQDLRLRKLSFSGFEGDAPELSNLNRNNAYLQKSSSPLLKSYFVQNGYQSDHLSVKSNSIQLNKKLSRKKQSGVESSSSSDNLDKKYNKMDLRE